MSQMCLEDVEQVVNETLEELGLTRNSFRTIRLHEDYIAVEFAAFDEEWTIETIRENFIELKERFGWQWINLETDANRIVVSMEKEKRITVCAPPLPRRQAMLVN